MLGAVPPEFELVLAQPFKRNKNAARRGKWDARKRLIKTSGNLGGAKTLSEHQERFERAGPGASMFSIQKRVVGVNLTLVQDARSFPRTLAGRIIGFIGIAKNRGGGGQRRQPSRQIP